VTTESSSSPSQGPPLKHNPTRLASAVPAINIYCPTRSISLLVYWLKYYTCTSHLIRACCRTIYFHSTVFANNHKSRNLFCMPLIVHIFLPNVCVLKNLNVDLTYPWWYLLKVIIFVFLALQPPSGVVFHSPLAGFSLLACEVSWSHTTHHSR